LTVLQQLKNLNEIVTELSSNNIVAI
jgi:hypothetical protein